MKATALREVAKALLREVFAAAWTLARLPHEIEARAGITVTTKHVERVLRREVLWPPAVLGRKRAPATPRKAAGARDARGRGHEGHGGQRRLGTLIFSDIARELLIGSRPPGNLWFARASIGYFFLARAPLRLASHKLRRAYRRAMRRARCPRIQVLRSRSLASLILAAR